MNELLIYHGSNHVVQSPQYGIGNPENDYGLGFYCTQSLELAKEWACSDTHGGYANEYMLHADGLRILDLDRQPYGILHWLSVLATNRKFEATTPLMASALDFVRREYHVDFDGVDIVCGWRADDSYFSFARAFLNGSLSMRQLERALRLGNLGRQVVLMSPKAFEAVSFNGAERAEGEEWYPKRAQRDNDARAKFLEMRSEPFLPEDIFIVDIMRDVSR